VEDFSDLQERLKLYKEETGRSYKAIAQDLNIPLTTLYNFTGSGRMKYCHQIKLDEYLSDRDY
jgi:DNA-directed RNA polymerase specialized sigma24 family protein